MKTEEDDLPELLDGPRFVAWVKARFPEHEGQWTTILGDRMEKNMRDWKAGRHNPSVEKADLLCCQLSIHINDIPDEIWIPKQKKGQHG